MTNRIALLKNELRKRKLDSLLITKDVNVSYETGFQGHDAVAIRCSAAHYAARMAGIVFAGGIFLRGIAGRISAQIRQI